MQIGDKIQVTGTVRDIVGGSVLVAGDDDSHEYWFLERHVKPQTPATPPAEGETPAPAEHAETKKHKS